jgi:hypothetical protein
MERFSLDFWAIRLPGFAFVPLLDASYLSLQEIISSPF